MAVLALAIPAAPMFSAAARLPSGMPGGTGRIDGPLAIASDALDDAGAGNVARLDRQADEIIERNADRIERSAAGLENRAQRGRRRGK